jgi:hypothetical protein
MTLRIASPSSPHHIIFCRNVFFGNQSHENLHFQWHFDLPNEFKRINSIDLNCKYKSFTLNLPVCPMAHLDEETLEVAQLVMERTQLTTGVYILWCLEATPSIPDYWANIYFKTNFNH